MNMPVVALLWPDHAKREPDTVLRMLEVLDVEYPPPAA